MALFRIQNFNALFPLKELHHGALHIHTQTLCLTLSYSEMYSILKEQETLTLLKRNRFFGLLLIHKVNELSTWVNAFIT
jgi:hypothetical protein